MRRGHKASVLLLCALALGCLLARAWHGAHTPAVRAQRSAPAATALMTRATTPPAVHTPTLAAAEPDPQAFARRARCADYRYTLGTYATPEALAYLCSRKPLQALQILIPLAEAGDADAAVTIRFLAQHGQCDALLLGNPAHVRTRTLELARRQGATDQQLERLTAILTEQEHPSTADEVAACRVSFAELPKLEAMQLGRYSEALGHPVEPPRDEVDERDLRIEYLRKTVRAADANAAVELAGLLIGRGTDTDRAEALALLQEAAKGSVQAAGYLGKVLLYDWAGPDQPRGRALVMQAAAEGDRYVLEVLAPTPGLIRNFDDNPAGLSVAERYAWNQFRQRLTEEGCLGVDNYVNLVWYPPQPTSTVLAAMTPGEAKAAEEGARTLIATQLARTRAQLGCD